MRNYKIEEEGKFKFVETGGEGIPIVILHGLFGALSNFESVIDYFGKSRNVVVPILPIFEGPVKMPTVKDLVKYVTDFIEMKDYKHVHVLGNSLGGHLTLLYALDRPERVKSIILTGSSGLYETSLGSTFPRRGSYEFVEKKTQEVFYDPKVASKELIDEVYEIVNNRSKALRVVVTAKSALRHNLAKKLHAITAPTLLIWGSEDDITPPEAARKFDELIPNTELYFIEKCKHAPMMEHPEQFNALVEDFLKRVENPAEKKIA